MSKHLNLFVTRTYTQESKEMTNYTKVGAVFPHEKGDGMNITIEEGISVSGTLVAFPPREDDKKS